MHLKQKKQSYDCPYCGDAGTTTTTTLTTTSPAIHTISLFYYNVFCSITTYFVVHLSHRLSHRFAMPFYRNKGWIYVRYFIPHSKDKLLYYIHEYVDDKHWSKKRQRVLTSSPRADHINKVMDIVSDTITATVDDYKVKGMHLTVTTLRDTINSRLFGNQNAISQTTSLAQFINIFLDQKRASGKAPSTIKAYKSKLTGILKTYPQLQWEDITYIWAMRAYEDLTKTWSHNNTSKALSVLSTLLTEAAAQGHFKGTIPPNLVPDSKDAEFIYLTKDQIHQILDFDYNDAYLTNAVILWGILYYSAQRVSDLENVINTPPLIVKSDKYSRFNQSKTGTKVSIPITAPLQRLMDQRPHIISDQKLNKYIKIAAHTAELGDISKLITCHTARRSSATNMALAGLPLHMIIPITGHKSIKQLMTYIKYSDLQISISIAATTEFTDWYK